MKIEEKISGYSITDLPKELEEDVNKLYELIPHIDSIAGIDYPYKLVLQGNPLKYKKYIQQLREEVGDCWYDCYLRFNH